MKIEDYIIVLNKHKVNNNKEEYYYTLINLLEIVYKTICKFELNNKKDFIDKNLEKWDRDLNFRE